MNILILIISLVGILIVIGLTRLTSRPKDSNEYGCSKFMIGIFIVAGCIFGGVLLMYVTMSDAFLEKYLKENDPNISDALFLVGMVLLSVHSAVYYSSLRFAVKNRKLSSYSIYGSRLIYLTMPYEHIFNKSSGNPVASMHVFKQENVQIRLTRFIVGLEGLLEEISRESKDGVIQYRTIKE